MRSEHRNCRLYAGQDMSNDRVSGTAKIGTRTSRVVRVLRQAPSQFNMKSHKKQLVPSG